MKNKNSVTIRYMGNDERRRYVIQRGDNKFWTGTGWTKILDAAKIFTNSKTVGLTCNALQHKLYKGKPLRSFKMEVTINLVADDANNVSHDDLIRFLAEAVKIGIDNAVCGDGPIDNSYVYAKPEISTLREVPSEKKVF